MEMEAINIKNTVDDELEAATRFNGSDEESELDSKAKANEIWQKKTQNLPDLAL